MSYPNQDQIEDIEKEIKMLETNEMLSALKDSWMENNKESLKDEFIKDYSEEFEDYCNEAYEENR